MLDVNCCIITNALTSAKMGTEMPPSIRRSAWA
jgi:hypothetical protein